MIAFSATQSTHPPTRPNPHSPAEDKGLSTTFIPPPGLSIVFKKGGISSHEAVISCLAARRPAARTASPIRYLLRRASEREGPLPCEWVGGWVGCVYVCKRVVGKKRKVLRIGVQGRDLVLLDTLDPRPGLRRAQFPLLLPPHTRNEYTRIGGWVGGWVGWMCVWQARV